MVRFKHAVLYLPEIVGSVKYENISFRFTTSGPLQLCNINIEFPAGTFVAIVGQSGSGKSTMMKLLIRLYEQESGRILIDGYDTAKVELYSLRRQIGVVPQDTMLFDGTVHENIALTNPDATTEEIIEAACLAAAHEFIVKNADIIVVMDSGKIIEQGSHDELMTLRGHYSYLYNQQDVKLSGVRSQESGVRRKLN